MRLSKSFRHALSMVVHAKVRSWLTILGIVIGVAAVIAIVSLGESLQQNIGSQLGDLGGDLLTLQAGRSRAMMFMSGGGNRMIVGGGSSASTEEVVLDRTDLQVLKGIDNIKAIDTQIRGNAEVYYVAEKGSVSIIGVDTAAWSQVTTEEIAAGRMLGPADANVIVIGGRLADGFFSKDLGVNQVLTIEGRLFRIVGILDSQSSNIYMPLEQAYSILEDSEKDVYDTIIIQIKDEDKLNETMSKIESKLRIARHVTEAKQDFSISSNKVMAAQRSEMMSSLTTFLTAIAAVALLVGAVGIANTMFTSVLEKTKEIGIMKAIGARNSDIMIMFLMNAALIGLIGGIIGIAIGVMLSGFLPAMMGAGAMRFGAGGTYISIRSIIVAVSMSVFIGMAAGAIPAYQASKLKPVDALRYE